MVDLVPIGPYRILEVYGTLGFMVYPAIEEGWSVIMKDDEGEEYTQTNTRTIDGGLGRKLEITYLVMPNAIETHVEVRLNLKDLGSRSRAVYGSIKASAIDYGEQERPSLQLLPREELVLSLWLHVHSSTESTCDCIALSSTFQTPCRGGPKNNHNLRQLRRG
ncbi:hypothetical protein GQ55_2G365300 [Panicum hallii var. hallii]|uniref:Uncharacterized protein n=1 Tax=Panicum hallii var. hallii TaxID=1504633 RepID=A0A2T7EW94_9POAL|nr:hypothetical protein GQ55_2G365300 [Panicum hallii var. hallii]PUZ72089.1 hypothetical protein GQ55_2G365300 [Panicum hallii var. hallii]